MNGNRSGPFMTSLRYQPCRTGHGAANPCHHAHGQPFCSKSFSGAPIHSPVSTLASSPELRKFSVLILFCLPVSATEASPERCVEARDPGVPSLRCSVKTHVCLQSGYSLIKTALRALRGARSRPSCTLLLSPSFCHGT